MVSGGARNRSGPQSDPNSARSDARGISLTALPNEGYRGEPPAFPLPGVSERETVLWGRVWRSPQACAWAIEPWRHYTVGQYVRWAVKCELEDASASLVAQMIRLADQIGLTPAGLKENGWAIAPDELGAKAAEAPAERRSSRDRIKVAG